MFPMSEVPRVVGSSLHNQKLARQACLSQKRFSAWPRHTSESFLSKYGGTSLTRKRTPLELSCRSYAWGPMVVLGGGGCFL